jgi:hypothetical protein
MAKGRGNSGLNKPVEALEKVSIPKLKNIKNFSISALDRQIDKEADSRT